MPSIVARVLASMGAGSIGLIGGGVLGALGGAVFALVTAGPSILEWYRAQPPDW